MRKIIKVTCGELSMIWFNSPKSTSVTLVLLVQIMTKYYVFISKIDINILGISVTTYQYLTYGHFLKISTSVQATPGTNCKYLIYGHITKININY